MLDKESIEKLKELICKPCPSFNVCSICLSLKCVVEKIEKLEEVAKLLQKAANQEGTEMLETLSEGLDKANDYFNISN